MIRASSIRRPILFGLGRLSLLAGGDDDELRGPDSATHGVDGVLAGPVAGVAVLTGRAAAHLCDRGTGFGVRRPECTGPDRLLGDGLPVQPVHTAAHRFRVPGHAQGGVRLRRGTGGCRLAGRLNRGSIPEEVTMIVFTRALAREFRL